MSEIVDLFPTPVLVTTLDSDPSIAQMLDQVELDMTKCSAANYNVGLVSKDTYILKQPEFKELADQILEHVRHYAREVMLYEFQDIVITQSWVSVKQPGQRHVHHVHPNSIVSGCFYWQEDQEPISFSRKDELSDYGLGVRHQQRSNKYSTNFYNIQAKKNCLLLFPSDLRHGVNANTSTTDRWSLSFNTMITGGIGCRSNLTELIFDQVDSTMLRSSGAAKNR